MSDHLPTMTAAADTIEIGGTPYRLAPLTYADYGELENWVNRQMPDPKAIAREMLEGLPEAIAEKLILEAFRVARQGGVRINSPEAQAVLASPPGAVQVLWRSLRKHQPNLLAADVERLMGEMGASALGSIERFIYGEGGDDPKAETGPATSRPRRGGKSSSR